MTAPLLRDVGDADLASFYVQQRDPEASAMADFPSRDLPAFTEHWAKIRIDPTNVIRTIEWQGQVAGNVVSWRSDGRRLVGYWLGKAYWGKGIATRALGEFLATVDERPLYAHVAPHNAGSIRVLAKCGFREIAREPGDILMRLDPEARG